MDGTARLYVEGFMPKLSIDPLLTAADLNYYEIPCLINLLRQAYHLHNILPQFSPQSILVKQFADFSHASKNRK